MIETLGRYKILGIIGQGAMGTVYRAVDPVIDRVVAIKTVNLTLNRADIEEYELRFQQEIKAAGRLNHPNIVTIYDVGRTDEMAYMAMEFLEGKELKDVLAEGTIPEVRSTVDWISQVAQGLGYAHEHEIIHRDVKPSNIMLTRSGLAKITDFGIARIPSSAVKTMTGLILGSPRYMSPEQVIGRDLDPRTDIFSLGVVLYEALTGVPPFDGENVNAIMYATVNNSPAPPSSLNRAVPNMLDLIVAKALAKMPDERYTSMREFATDLDYVKRSLESKRAAPVATTAPPAAKSPSFDSLLTGRLQKESPVAEEVKPLKLATAFDSFDATLKLAAMTNQTAEFEKYISDTKKMRVFQLPEGHKLAAATGGHAAAPNRDPHSITQGNRSVRFNHLEQLEQFDSARRAPRAQPAARASDNLIPIVIIVLLAAMAVGLAVALALR
ncbi:MAG TPA: serine/threonine-protein kinase [Usitatibacteraceae bacterium]|nr:serine/threonine-protein kinase [Usitatibacteraceae bacterium]